MSAPTRTSPITDAHRPLSSGEWIRKWHGTTNVAEAQTGIIKGREVFPTSYKRQDQLVTAIINAAMELAVFEELKEGTSLANLQNQGLLKNSNLEGNTIPVLDAQVSEVTQRKKPDNTPDQQAINEGLLHILRSLRKGGFIKTAEDIVSEEKHGWARYQNAVENYYAQRRLFLNRQKEGIHSGGLLEKPLDPRVNVLNANYTNMWIKIKESGAKSDFRTLQKCHERGANRDDTGEYLLQDHLRDMTRITILVRSPQVADDFFLIMQDKFPPKKLGEETVDRLFVEGWNLKQSGYFDKTAYMVASEKSSRTKLPEGKGQGLISEIKVVGREMERADYLSHPVYEAWRNIDMDKLFPKKGKGQGEGFRQNRIEYMNMYNGLRNEFIQKSQELGLTYHFPPFKAERLDDRGYYNELFQELTQLRKNIHLDGINSEPHSGWAREYVQVAYAREAELNQGAMTGKKRFLPEVEIKKVGARHFINHIEMRKEAYAAYNAQNSAVARTR